MKIRLTPREDIFHQEGANIFLNAVKISCKDIIEANEDRELESKAIALSILKEHPNNPACEEMIN